MERTIIGFLTITGNGRYFSVRILAKLPVLRYAHIMPYAHPRPTRKKWIGSSLGGFGTRLFIQTALLISIEYHSYVLKIFLQLLSINQSVGRHSELVSGSLLK